jgi:hypothetical protein
VARFSALLNQTAPLKHDVFADRKNPLIEHGPHPVREPIIKPGPAFGLYHKLDAKPNFSQGYRADVKLT